MSEEAPGHDQPDEPVKPKAAGGDLILPVVAVLFTIYYFTTIRDVPWTAQVSALLVGSVLVILCFVFGLRTLFAIRRGEQTLSVATLFAPRDFIVKRLALLALAIGYVFVIAWLGFTITTFLFLSAAMLLLSDGEPKRQALLLAALLSIGGYLLFIVAFETRFPEGPFETLMEGLF